MKLSPYLVAIFSLLALGSQPVPQASLEASPQTASLAPPAPVKPASIQVTQAPRVTPSVAPVTPAVIPTPEPKHVEPELEPTAKELWKVEGPDSVTIGQKAKYVVVGPSQSAEYAWSLPDSLESGDSHELLTANSMLLFMTEPNVYDVRVAVKDGANFLVLKKVIELKAPQPPPGPVTPPVVDPPVTPPVTPVTPPVTPPVVGRGLRVLIVEESNDRGMLPSAQQSAMGSVEIRRYVDTHCKIGPDGKTREFRIFDKDADLSGETKVWQDMFALAKGKPLPWIVLTDGVTSGTSELMPKNVAETLKLLKRYGGE